jgi:hypothetical protein
VAFQQTKPLLCERAALLAKLILSIPALLAMVMGAKAYEIVVYGGSPAGVAAAVAAAEQGRSVALLASGKTVGGAISNGLGAADVGGTTAVTGFPLRFFEQVRAKYQSPETFDVPPGEAERIFRAMLSKAGVTVLSNLRLDAAEMDAGRIKALRTSAGRLEATVFVDASYTGDLVAASGAAYRIGYQDYYHYGEPTLERTIYSAAEVGDDPTPFLSNPYLQPGRVHGRWADMFQLGRPSMTFRLCVTKDPAKRVPWTPTKNFETYAPSWRLYLTGYLARTASGPSSADLSPFFQIAATQEGKFDMNQGGGSFLNVPAPDAIFGPDRENAIAAFADYHRNWMAFLANDPASPVSIRQSLSEWGLCADEFTDNGNWPYEPYIRDGRRILGLRTLTVHNMANPALRVAEESAAIGTYSLDNKLSLIYYWNGHIYRDKGTYIRTPRYEIDWRTMVPVNVDNLLVPVGISASPRAYGSVRMEPQYMALGEAAGLAAHIAILHGITVPKVPYASLRYLLERNGAMFKLAQLCPRIAKAYRASAGFDPETCAPAPFEMIGANEKPN